MSLWLRRKDPEGRTHIIASGAWGFILLVGPILCFLMAFLLPLIQACRR